MADSNLEKSLQQRISDLGEQVQQLCAQLVNGAKMPGSVAPKSSPKRWLSAFVRRVNPFARWIELQYERTAALAQMQLHLTQLCQAQLAEHTNRLDWTLGELQQARTQLAENAATLAGHTGRLDWTLGELQKFAVTQAEVSAEMTGGVAGLTERLEWTLGELQKFAVSIAEHANRLDWSGAELQKFAVSLAEHTNRLDWAGAELQKFAATDVEQMAELAQLQAQAARFTEYLTALLADAQALKVQVVELPAAIDTRMKIVETMAVRQEEWVAPMRERMARLDGRVNELADRTFDAHYRAQAPTCAPDQTVPNGVPPGEFNFLKWEEFTRGSESGIADQQRVYAQWFGGMDRPVLDAGCGRGEFLEVLRAGGVEAYGIDTDAYMVEHCCAKELRVEQGDLFTHLGALPDESLGGLFLGHVVEHLPLDVLLALVPLAYRKLAPGAALIMETPNPMCLTTFSGAFYADPTHLKPVHPKALEFLCGANGFAEMMVIPSAPVPPDNKLKQLAETDPIQPVFKDLVLQMNRNITHLNEVLFSYGNYAMAARKPKADLT